MTIGFYYMADIFSDYLNRQSEQYVKAQALLIERLFQGKLDIVNAPEIDSTLKEIGPHIPCRITLALPDGRLLGDSQEDVSKIRIFP